MLWCLVAHVRSIDYVPTLHKYQVKAQLSHCIQILARFFIGTLSVRHLPTAACRAAKIRPTDTQLVAPEILNIANFFFRDKRRKIRRVPATIPFCVLLSSKSKQNGPPSDQEDWQVQQDDQEVRHQRLAAR